MRLLWYGKITTINAWHQIEGLRENVLHFKESWIGRNRNIKSKRVPTSTGNKENEEALQLPASKNISHH